MKSSILYDRILRSRIMPVNNSHTSFSVDINSPSKRLKGVLLIFTKERSATKYKRDTEEFYNPKITKVEVTVEGSPNELYAQNMEYRHQYDEITLSSAHSRFGLGLACCCFAAPCSALNREPLGRKMMNYETLWRRKAKRCWRYPKRSTVAWCQYSFVLY